MSPKPELSAEGCRIYAGAVVRRAGRSARWEALRLFQADLISAREFLLISKELGYQLNEGPRMFDPNQRPAPTHLELRDREVALLRRENAMLVGNSLGAIASGMWRYAKGDRETALTVGHFVNTLSDITSFKGDNTLLPNNEARATKPKYYDRAAP